MDNEKKNIVYHQNPKIDFLFGYFGKLQVPTKQDAFKPIDVVHTDEMGVETILKAKY